MLDFLHKYNSKIILFAFSAALILSCVRKHKFADAKVELSDRKMTDVLVDIFLMESYVNEQLPGMQMDSLTFVKASQYNRIFKHHHTDSAAFYSTFNYYQAHPKEFSVLLRSVDSSLNKIKPLDTTSVRKIVETPDKIEDLPDFRQQERFMREQYIKTLKDSQKIKPGFRKKNNKMQ